jgi:hypothetical protein
VARAEQALDVAGLVTLALHGTERSVFSAADRGDARTSREPGAG